MYLTLKTTSNANKMTFFINMLPPMYFYFTHLLFLSFILYYSPAPVCSKLITQEYKTYHKDQLTTCLASK